jgi:hypothetical protein
MGGTEEEESESEWCGNVVYIASYSYSVVTHPNTRTSLCPPPRSRCKPRQCQPTGKERNFLDGVVGSAGGIVETPGSSRCVDVSE